MKSLWLCLAALLLCLPICQNFPLLNGDGATETAANEKTTAVIKFWPLISDAEIAADMAAVEKAINTPWVERSSNGVQRMETKRDNMSLTDAQKALFNRHWELETIQREKPTAPKQFPLELFAEALDTIIDMEPEQRVVHLPLNKLKEWATGSVANGGTAPRQQDDVPIADADEDLPTTTEETSTMEVPTTTTSGSTEESGKHVEEGKVEGEESEEKRSATINDAVRSYEDNETKVFEEIRRLKGEQQRNRENEGTTTEASTPLSEKTEGNTKVAVESADISDEDQPLNANEKEEEESGKSVEEGNKGRELVDEGDLMTTIGNLLNDGNASNGTDEEEEKEPKKERKEKEVSREEIEGSAEQPVVVIGTDDGELVEVPGGKQNSDGFFSTLSRLLFGGRKKREVTVEMMPMVQMVDDGGDDGGEGIVVDEIRADELPRGIVVAPTSDDNNSSMDDGDRVSLFSNVMGHFKEQMAMMHAAIGKLFGIFGKWNESTQAEKGEEKVDGETGKENVPVTEKSVATTEVPSTETTSAVQGQNDAHNESKDGREELARYLFDYVARTGGVKRNEKLAYVLYCELQYWIAKRIEADFGDPSKRIGELLDRFAGAEGEKMEYLRGKWALTLTRLAELQSWIGKDFRRRK